METTAGALQFSQKMGIINVFPFSEKKYFATFALQAMTHQCVTN